MHALRGALIGLFLVGCTHRHDVRRLDRPEAIPGALGQRVAAVGVAANGKGGPRLVGDAFDLWIDTEPWPAHANGQRVEVVGVLEERHDLPVFVPRAGEPTIAGIPVPEGTALHAASRRFVLTQPQWRVLR